MDRKLILNVLFAVALFFAIQALVNNTVTQIWNLDPRNFRTGTPWYRHMIQVFYWLSILAFAATVIINAIIAFCNKAEKSRKLLWIISLASMAFVLLLVLVARFTIPVSGVEVNPAPFLDGGLYTAFRGVAFAFLIPGLIMTFIAGCMMGCCKKGEGEKQAKEPKQVKENN
ncbi:MAG: hypothetical protein FWE16_00795 [Firmicutes bacterium]|nr:hypothetical protein [Bacillota bacterium]